MTPSSPQEPSGIAEHPLSPPHRGWYSRGYLPHCDYPGLLQSITYRLADSLPASALERIEAEVRSLPPQQRTRERRRRIEAWLDAGYGCCVLGRPEAAACVVENWRHFAGARYDLIAWVVMPNHVHLLIRVYEGVSLGKVVQSWKSYTGRRIGAMMEEGRAGARRSQAGGSQAMMEEGRAGARRSQAGGSQATMEEGRAGARRSQAGGSQAGWSSDEVVGGVWMREYWDRYIRDERHFEAVVGYIHDNPVKAGLVKKAEDWPWSSAREWAEGAELALGDPGGPGGAGDPGEEGAEGAELALGDPGGPGGGRRSGRGGCRGGRAGARRSQRGWLFLSGGVMGDGGSTMGLLDKVRILVGALARKPFTPRREKVDLAEDEGGREGRGSAQAGGGMEAEPQPVPDEERVADLLARREHREEG